MHFYVKISIAGVLFFKTLKLLMTTIRAKKEQMTSLFVHVYFSFKFFIKIKFLREIINCTSEFWYFINGTLSFFYYQWKSRIIERLTTVTFLNFFRPKSYKTVNFLLCFKLKNKRKRKKN